MDASISSSTGIVGPVEARAAGIVFVSDEMPGITRRRCGRGFAYYLPDGDLLRDEGELGRVKSLAVPPAYRDVWISPLGNGHLQATGRDDRDRKQYRYHDDYRALCERAKFDQMIPLGESLPELRRRIDEDMRARKLSRRKVLATAVRLLERTMIRVGNRAYLRDNQSVGLTTLRNDHVDLTGESLRLVFRGKGGKPYRLKLRDRRVANTIRRLEDIGGQHLFQWQDEDGEFRDVTSTDVNEYIREATGADYTAKYFRTWGGTVLMARALTGVPAEFGSKTEGNRNLVAAIDEVAAVLGNTRTVCRNSYIHPAVVDAYMGGDFAGRIEDPDPRGLPFAEEGLSPLERSVLDLLRRA